ncbi:DUF2809 domain-containing protein [Agromyces intestinalis]|uniref:DUF2809 domain-containing protein n=1 Tax=Agromyces intestinalis TaxID=2592652 RepID=A0A5C1YFX7_9MICO|nr:DUF2809 domain-containing protein [Agromyces intestinalis]QEO14548.1 DUF2809 domain-containing protein [Agromyces intestinalis]
MPRARPHRRVRLIAALAAFGCLGLGLALQILDRTPVVDVLGSVLYAALIGCLVLVAAPTLRPWAVGAIAYGVSAAVELLQLTGLPAVVVAAVPPARLVLGSSFDPWDLVAYAGGAALAYVVAARAQVRRPRITEAVSRD